MQLIQAPVALPGKCKGCGTGDPSRGPFLDTGLSEEFYGAVYYCRSCVMGMADMFGCSSPEQTLDLKFKIEVLEAEKFNLITKADGLERAVNGLRDAGFRISDGIDSPVGHSEDASQELSTGEESLGGEGGTASEPSNDQDVGEFRSNESSPIFELNL